MYKYGFLGAGNMNGALAMAMTRGLPAGVTGRTPERAALLSASLGLKLTDNLDIAANSKYILLGIKPQILPEVCEQISSSIKDSIIITMAAGVKIQKLCELLGRELPVIRIMPNIPVSIGRGVILSCKNSLVSDEDLRTFMDDFKGAGSFIELEEELIDAASVISGCGPAYIYMYTEAMARAGESLGLPYELSRSLAAMTAVGAGELASSSHESLSELTKAVCSPGGSTVEGVYVLEEGDLKGLVSRALAAAYRRTKELSEAK